MNEGQIWGFWKMGPLNAFDVKAIENHSHFGPTRLLLLCVQSSENVSSVWTNAMQINKPTVMFDIV